MGRGGVSHFFFSSSRTVAAMALAPCRHLRAAPCRGPGRLKRRPSPLTCSPLHPLSISPRLSRSPRPLPHPKLSPMAATVSILPPSCRSLSRRSKATRSSAMFPSLSLCRESSWGRSLGRRHPPHRPLPAATHRGQIRRFRSPPPPMNAHEHQGELPVRFSSLLRPFFPLPPSRRRTRHGHRRRR